MKKEEIYKMEIYLNDKIIELSKITSNSEMEICLIMKNAFLVDCKKNKEEIDYINYWISELEEEENLSECCGEEITDLGLCSDCKEHCE